MLSKIKEVFNNKKVLEHMDGTTTTEEPANSSTTTEEPTSSSTTTEEPTSSSTTTSEYSYCSDNICDETYDGNEYKCSEWTKEIDSDGNITEIICTELEKRSSLYDGASDALDKLKSTTNTFTSDISFNAKSVGKNILIFMIVIWFILAIYTFILYWNNYILPTDLIPVKLFKTTMASIFNIPFLIWHYFNNSPHSSENIKNELKKFGASPVVVTGKNIVDKATKTINKAVDASAAITNDSIDKITKKIIGKSVPDLSPNVSLKKLKPVPVQNPIPSVTKVSNIPKSTDITNNKSQKVENLLKLLKSLKTEQ